MLSSWNADRNSAGASPPTRRAVLQGALAATMVGGAAGVTRAQDKVRQTLVQYQGKPKGDQQCDSCVQWEPPDSCKVVVGKISPRGWCALYLPKPK